jgi:hypothetical protein
MSSQGRSLRLDEVESTVHGDSTELIYTSNKLKQSWSIVISSCTAALRSVNADTLDSSVSVSVALEDLGDPTLRFPNPECHRIQWFKP